MKHEIVIYQHAELVSPIEVILSENSVWLTRQQMGKLFNRDVKTVGKHINNLLKNETTYSPTVAKFATVQKEGEREVTRNITHYNLNLILAVGHRVKSNQSAQFHIWANNQITKFDQKSSTLRLIHSKIFQIRGSAVMLDSDLASFYQTETRILKQAVRRNLDRFPDDFMFELDTSEVQYLGSQSVIPLHRNTGKSKPFAFTEQGVAMLSAVLNTPIAVEISLKIMRAFVEIRKLALSQYNTENRLTHLEKKHIEVEMRQIKTEERQIKTEEKQVEIKQQQLQTEEKLSQLFEAIDEKKLTPNQGVFFDGQIFDAHKLVSDIISTAQSNIILIDNYVDDSVLTLLGKKSVGVSCSIHTKHISEQLRLDTRRFNEQYGGQSGNGASLTLYSFNKAHDRFLIIDRKEVYHFGASLKDLGKKWFAFTKLDSFAEKILQELPEH